MPSSLNHFQQQAVSSIHGPTMILAGAGTGKTRVITNRISHMILSGIDPSSIVALTFTNKAAKEMSDRVRHLVEANRIKNLWLGTFHSFCISILRQFHSEVGLARNFVLVGTSDQIDLVSRVLEEKHLKNIYSAKDLHNLICRAKEHLLTAADVKASLPGEYDFIREKDVLAEVYSFYDRQLSLNYAVDFEDLILKTYLLLKNSQKVKQKINEKYKFFLVDEFQDTNFSQLFLLKELAESSSNVCVVGDDDQSIYGWRGARQEVFEEFKVVFPKAKIIKLEQNYRSTENILKAANSLIKHNVNRQDKVLWSDISNSDPILFSVLENDFCEAQWVARKCISLLERGYKKRDIGVLYRTNAQSKMFEIAFQELRLRYKTFGGQSFFERKEVKDFFSYVRFVLNHNDLLSLWRIINIPSRGIGLKTMEQIKSCAIEKRLLIYDLLKKSEVLTGINSKTRAILNHFVGEIENLAQFSIKSPDDAEFFGNEIIKRFSLEEYIKISVDDSNVRFRKIELLKSLPYILKNLTDEYLKTRGELTPETLVDLFTLSSDVEDRDEDFDEGDYISIMTIHSAKGLEFPAVFVSGLEDGTLPHRNCLNTQKEISEERRLFYVALTRAKARLFLSYSIFKKGNFGRNISNLPSRFLKEIPEEYLLSDEKYSNTDIISRKAATLETLSKIREKLF